MLIPARICVCGTVHLVPGRLHQGEVCGCQACPGAAGLPGRSEERTGAGSRVNVFRFVLLCFLSASLLSLLDNSEFAKLLKCKCILALPSFQKH